MMLPHTHLSLDADSSWSITPSQLELIQTHYRTPVQVPYRLPAGSAGINISALLLDLVDALYEGDCYTGQAVKKFDELLGLCSNNIKSFTEEYCPEHEGLFETTKTFLCAVAGHIAKSSFDESETVEQENNGGILAAARFLAPYVYVVGSGGQAMFLPEGEISYANQRAGFWQESLPKAHKLNEWEASAAGQAIFAAIECQLKRLGEVETSVREGSKVSFWDSPIQVQYGAHFVADDSKERGSSQKSTFVLADQEMGEQIQIPEPAWANFAKQFGKSNFVRWQINEGFEDPLLTGLVEKMDLAKVFKENVTEVARENVEGKFPDAVVEAITLPQKVKFYDLTFLVDSSGSMHTKLEYLKPQITEIIATLKSQIMEPGMIRINFFTYGNEQTHAVGNGTWIATNQLSAADFTARLDATIKYVAENNLDLETAWYTVWDLYEGPNQKSWQKPEDKDGEYEHRIVILSDEEVDSPKNVVKIPTVSKHFDKQEAEAFIARHPNTSLKIIELSGNIEYQKWLHDQIRQGKIDQVVYNPADNAKCPEGMSYIPGRRFPRGGGGDSNEQPWSVVTVDALCMDQIEMTNEKYEMTMKSLDDQIITHMGQEIIIDATPSREGFTREGFNGPNQPVVDVDWYHADLACKQQGKRLPTEAEWENAAKGPDGIFEYPTNDGSEPNKTNNNANFYRDTKDKIGTSDVEIYPDGPFGLEDMAGNVWEWTSDWYAECYDTNSLENPTGPANGKSKVLRGGSWCNDGQNLRSANRYYYHPDVSDPFNGFRCVQDLK